jgi:hypothetical protein
MLSYAPDDLYSTHNQVPLNPIQNPPEVTKCLKMLSQQPSKNI